MTEKMGTKGALLYVRPTCSLTCGRGRTMTAWEKQVWEFALSLDKTA